MSYKLLKCYPIAYDTRTDDNHIYIHALADNADYSLAVNVRSCISRSRLYYCIKEYDLSPQAESSGTLRQLLCWGELGEGLCGINPIGYARDNWVKSSDFIPAETDDCYKDADYHSRSVLDLDSNHAAAELVELIARCIDDPDAFIVCIGKLWGPKPEADRTFGFVPAQGIHDIHANDDGCDGVIVFYYPKSHKAVAVFNRFRFLF